MKLSIKYQQKGSVVTSEGKIRIKFLHVIELNLLFVLVLLHLIKVSDSFSLHHCGRVKSIARQNESLPIRSRLGLRSNVKKLSKLFHSTTTNPSSTTYEKNHLTEYLQIDQQPKQKHQQQHQGRNIPSKIVRIYAEYASRLWRETNHESRRRIAKDKVTSTIEQVQSTLLKAANWKRDGIVNDGDAYDVGIIYGHVPEQQRLDLYNACEAVLRTIQSTQEKTNVHLNVKRQSITQNEQSLLKTQDVLQQESLTANHVHESSNNVAGTRTSIDWHMNESNIVASVPSSSISPSSLSPSNGVLNGQPSHSLSSDSFSEALSTPSKSSDSTTRMVKKVKSRRSIAFGALMGAVVTCWVFSGNYIFTGLFTLMTVLGQLEYYRMIMQTGTYPARRISVLGACSMFMTALLCPDLHQICLPMFGLITMVGFLYFKKSTTSISEIATTFTGMFYLGYVPSFWVRIRLIGMDRQPTRLAPIVGPILNFIGTTAKQQAQSSTIIPTWLPQAVHLPITTGAIFIFWTWLCLAFSDVGAYFVGKNFGKTKLSAISPAAGATSPNKSVEGVVGGCVVSAILAMLGAWIQRWPYPIFTGAIHGILLGLLGLLGDLTASMIKRDAGVKDFGDLLPEHGGIMDRVDSFIWAAPYSWLVCRYIIPGLKAITGKQLDLTVDASITVQIHFVMNYTFDAERLYRILQDFGMVDMFML